MATHSSILAWKPHGQGSLACRLAVLEVAKSQTPVSD